MTTTANSQFDESSTAQDVLQGVDMTGKLAVVTGGGGGLGYETARALMASGADVVIGGRTPDKLNKAAGTLAKKYPDSRIESFVLDLADLESVDRFADDIIALDRPIDMLIANAGIMACPLARTNVGLEMQFGTNYVGHALLVSRLSSSLRTGGDTRVVCLSSSGHHFAPVTLDDLNFEKRDYDKWVAYGQSKTACALLARKVQTEMRDRDVTGLAVHPGVIGTDLMRHLTEDDYAALSKRPDAADPASRKRKTVEQGAATTVWAASEPSLKGKFAYLEDCQIAEPVETPNTVTGVLPHAEDPVMADRLWVETEKLIGREMPL